MKKSLIVACLFLGTGSLYAQDCRVLLSTINDSYEGGCKKGKAQGHGTADGIDTYTGEFKKGFPHGNGIYTWSNGNIFDGNWEKGERNGEGKLTIKGQDIDSVVNGFWKNDRYIGLYETPFNQIDKSPNISSYAIKDIADGGNGLRFYLKKDQKLVYNPEANIIVHHGQYSDIARTRDYLELENVTFPFKARVYFDREFIEFEIFQPGKWEVRTDITQIKGLNTPKN